MSNVLDLSNEKDFENTRYEDGGIEKVILPKGVKRIPERKFYCCLNLKELVNFEDIEIIEKGAFFNTLIKLEDMPKGVKEVGYSRFDYRNNNWEVTVPKTVEVYNILGALSVHKINIHDNTKLIINLNEVEFYYAAYQCDIDFDLSILDQDGNLKYIIPLYFQSPAVYKESLVKHDWVQNTKESFDEAFWLFEKLRSVEKKNNFLYSYCTYVSYDKVELNNLAKTHITKKLSVLLEMHIKNNNTGIFYILNNNELITKTNIKKLIEKAKELDNQTFVDYLENYKNTRL